MSDREQRAAENESRFRSVNERIEDAALRWNLTDGRVEFLCECDNPQCMTRVPLTLREYENVRTVSTDFFVTPGHENDGVESVIARHATYTVVRKSGEAAHVAAERDQRS